MHREPHGIAGLQGGSGVDQTAFDRLVRRDDPCRIDRQRRVVAELVAVCVERDHA
jgi:hypothetical protein